MKIEQLRSARPAGGRVDQHRVGREESGEHDDVAEQENPKAVAHDDAFGWHAASYPRGRRPAVGNSVVAPGRGLEGAHGVTGVVSSSPRAARLARSMRATSSAGTMYSVLSRHANTTNVA